MSTTTTTIEEQTVAAVLKEKTPFVVGESHFLLFMNVENKNSKII